MRVTRTAEPDEVSLRFVAAARAAGVAANDDVSGPDLDGAAISPVTVWKGLRWSPARSPGPSESTTGTGLKAPGAKASSPSWMPAALAVLAAFWRGASLKPSSRPASA